jgi:ABC-type sugar transport system substrate-binding protein
VLFSFIFISLIAYTILLFGCGEDKEKIRVGVNIAGISHHNSQIIRQGIEDNAEKYGARVVHEKEGIAKLLSEGIHALILNCPYPRDLESYVKEVHRAGVPIVILDCPPPEGLHVEAYLRINHYDAGKMAADYVLRRLKSGGNVIILEGPRNDELARQITLGIYNVLEKQDSIKIVADEMHTGWDEKLAAETTRFTLNKYADNIQAVIAGSSELAIGSIRAISERRLSDKIITVGVGAGLEACEAIITGRHDAEVDMMPYDLGIEALNLAVAVAKDEDFGYDEDMGEYDPKIKVKFGPLRLVTRENISVMKTTYPQLYDES